MQRRGIGSVVATTIIVLVAILAVAILLAFVLPIAQEVETQEEVELSVLTGEGYTVYDSETMLASVQIKRGNDGAELLGIDVIFSVNGGSVDYTIPADNVTAPGETKLFKFNLTNYGAPESVNVFPVVEVERLRINAGVISSLPFTGMAVGASGLKEGAVSAEGVIVISNDEFLDSLEIGEECIPGDANCDCVVDILDVDIFFNNLGFREGMTWSEGDFDGDGDVDMRDFGILRAAFNRGDVCPTWEDSSFMVATWEDGQTLLGEEDLQSDGTLGAWDNTGRFPSYLDVVPDGEEGHGLRAEGLYGKHMFERVVSKNLPAFDSWAGSVEVNFKEMIFNEELIQERYRVTALAIVGGYENSATTIRNFVIQIENKSVSPNHPGVYTPAIFITAYQKSVSASLSLGKRFFIEDGFDGFEDRFVKIDWYFTPDNLLFARVENGEWESVPTYSNKVPFNKLWTGWVSSYNGGAINVRNAKLYGPDSIDDFIAEESYCEDSDGGIVSEVRGESSSSSEEILFTDSCVDGMKLEEYYCNGAKRKIIQIDCENGCFDGACVV
jgi:hypothetical protein